MSTDGRCGCGSFNTQANSWEAWCGDCDRQWTKEENPEIYDELRSVELTARSAHDPITTCDPVQIQARREALGLSQVKLAWFLPWKQTRISEVERGIRPWPAWAEARLSEAEAYLDEMAETLHEAGLRQVAAGSQVVVVPTYTDERAMYTDWPEMELDRVPSGVHRMATVKAWKMLRDEGHEARIVEVNPGVSTVQSVVV